MRSLNIGPGDKYGRLTVLRRAADRSTPKGRRIITWVCKCDCGTVREVRGMDLRNGHTGSCGCLRAEGVRRSLMKDLTGERFERLVVIQETEAYVSPSGTIRRIQWLCRCDCGESVSVATSALRSGKTRSCGCLHSDVTALRNTTHGQSQHRIYGVWRTMLSRCTNPNARTYPYYGGRGITVCERWRGPEGFANFLADMGDRPDTPIGAKRHWSIDRIDNDGPYAPDNCQWADPPMQAANKRGKR
jgi:hypothetical protein